ncbi:MAG: SpoIIE family protein phosphatase [Planctomycetaceae bacterium]|nr:SpoIIE family protein phosphatase [Planctomycetaceae bacterium]
MRDSSKTLPPAIVWSVVLACAVPALLQVAGVNFASRDPFRQLAIHTILEWTAFGVALVSVHFSMVQFSLRGDVSTPIIGTALFFSGSMDAFHTLAANGLILSGAAQRTDFVPFTWALSRILNALFIVGGASFFLRGDHAISGRTERSVRFLAMFTVLLGVAAYGVVHACSATPKLPRTIYLDSPIPRPWDAVPLILFLLGGAIVLPRFHRAHPSLFLHGLMLSILPQIAAQCHAAFGSRAPFDSDANIASFLKILAYQVPFYGLMLDYRRAYHAESSLRAAEEKLRIAREVQRGILPSAPPALAGLEMAGRSDPADVMGGDFFDYIPLPTGGWALVLADVSGHDVGASALMAQTRAYLRGVCRERSDPGAILSEANRFVADDVRGSRFCEVSCVCVNLERRLLTYAGAGHNAWIVEADDSQHELATTGPALGMVSDATIPAAASVPLTPGAVYVAVTDGIVEAESLGGVPFGVDRLLNTVRSHRARTAAEILAAIFQAVDQHTQSVPPRDDRTVVILKG